MIHYFFGQDSLIIMMIFGQVSDFRQSYATNYHRPDLKIEAVLQYVMVLPLVDEDRLKCYICHEGFDGIGELREHQESEHADLVRHEPSAKREPTPGDVAVF